MISGVENCFVLKRFYICLAIMTTQPLNIIVYPFALQHTAHLFLTNNLK